MISIGEEIEVDVVCAECGCTLEAQKDYIGYHGEFVIAVTACAECAERAESATETGEPETDVHDFALAVSAGNPLDKLAEMVGVERQPGESDAELRDRTERAKL